MRRFSVFLYGYLVGILVGGVLTRHSWKNYKPECHEIKLPPVDVKPMPKKVLVQFYPDPKPPAFDLPKLDSVEADTIKADTIPWHWDVLGRRIYHA